MMYKRYDSNSNNWKLITTLNVPEFSGRFQSQVLMFENLWAFALVGGMVDTHGPSGCVDCRSGIIGWQCSKDVTSPYDAVFASSSNSPGFRGCCQRN